MNRLVIGILLAALLTLGVAPSTLWANAPEAEGQSAGYEYDVLSGIRDGPHSHLIMTSGWHHLERTAWM